MAGLARRLGLAAVQLHGEETAACVAELRAQVPPGCEIWKAVRVAERIPADTTGADRVLLDTHRPDRRGGTGQRFDWGLLRGVPHRERMILAGGLEAGNVREARALGVGALDVGSGVESSPGVKDRARLDAFFAALRGTS